MTPPARGKAARRRHIKSRSGCKNCKKRKVKCGEERPSCRNCTRRGSLCDLADLADDVAVPSAPSGPDGARSAPSSSSLPLPRASPSSLGGAGPASLTLLDLELLHHYVISTGLTLSSDPVTRHYYLVNVPQLGFSHPYVLSSILALAASHLAHFRPESRQYYYAEATARHTAATSLAAPLLPHISAENSVPMYCFSSLTMFIAFADRKDDDRFFGADRVLPSWLALFRGLRTVLEANDGAILASPIAFLFRSGRHVNDAWGARPLDHEALRGFRDHLGRAPADDPARQHHLLAAFGHLRAAFAFFDGPEAGPAEDKTRSLFTWLYKIPDGYLDLLRQRNNHALCILAFFCVLLHRLECHWWLKGWGTHLIGRIHAAVDDAHHAWIRWPIQEIGWVPPRGAF